MCPGCHILLIDQNELVHRAMRRIFQRMGMTSSVAQTAQKLCSWWSSSLVQSKSSLDAIVLDVQLDNDDGFRLCEILRSHPFTQHIPYCHHCSQRPRHSRSGIQRWSHDSHPSLLKPRCCFVASQRIARRKAEAANQLLLVGLNDTSPRSCGSSHSSTWG